MKLFGRHYGTERFFIMIFVCLLALISIFVYGGNIKADLQKQTIASTALYTRNYKWSRTSATGRVVSLVSNSTNTKVFMLIQNDSLASFDAKDYEVFFTSTDGTRANDPKLTIYAYGTSGYVGFYFTDAKGFANEVVNIIVRNNTAASDLANENTMNLEVRDQSFIDNNQIQIIANFGADGMEKSTAMDGQNVNQLKLFTDTAGRLPSGTHVTSRLNNLQSKANSLLDDMNRSKLLYEQYAQNLDQMAVIVPEVPYYIASDIVNTAPNDFIHEPDKFTSEMIQNNNTSSGTNFLGGGSNNNQDNQTSKPNQNLGITGATYVDEETGQTKNYNYYHTDYLLPGTIHIDWQGRQMSDGFITQTSFYKDQIEPDMYSAYEAYINWRTDMMHEYESVELYDKVNWESWRKKDGSYVDPTNDTAGVLNIANSYENEVNNYIVAKSQYLQCIHDMLALEAELQLFGQNVTIFTDTADKKAIWLY